MASFWAPQQESSEDTALHKRKTWPVIFSRNHRSPDTISEQPLWGRSGSQLLQSSALTGRVYGSKLNMHGPCSEASWHYGLCVNILKLCYSPKKGFLLPNCISQTVPVKTKRIAWSKNCPHECLYACTWVGHPSWRGENLVVGLMSWYCSYFQGPEDILCIS